MNEKKVSKEIKTQAKIFLRKEEALEHIKHLACKKKWVEKDFGDFVQISSGLCRLKDEEIKEFHSILLRIPHTHLPRTLYFIVNQRFIDFISGKTNISFHFVSSLSEDLIELIEDWSGLEESICFLDFGEDIKKELDEKIQVAYVRPSKDSNRLKWESLKRIDRVRLFYSLIVLQGGLNSSKIGQIYQAVLTLIDIFVGESPGERTRGSLTPFDPIFEKLKVYFDEIKDNTSEGAIKNLYLLEYINNFEKKDLTTERNSLAKTSQSRKEQIEVFKSELDEAEKQIKENKRVITSQEEELELLRKAKQELEDAYSRLQEASQLETQAEVNSLVSRLSQDLKHQFLKLQRGLDKHIHDEKTKAQFGQIMSRIEKTIQMTEREK
ncbi:MAG: hypothetical protein WA939_20355 [Nodosilinea sp.]